MKILIDHIDNSNTAWVEFHRAGGVTAHKTTAKRAKKLAQRLVKLGIFRRSRENLTGGYRIEYRLSPIGVLKLKGWNADLFAQHFVNGVWKLTRADPTGPQGQYHVTMLTQYLASDYKVIKSTIHNAKIPNIIYIGMPKRTHKLHLTLIEK